MTKLILNFVGITENIYSIPIYSTHSYGIATVEATRTFLLMVCNGEGVMRTVCALGQVFTAFSGPKEITMYEWFRIPEPCTFADWLSAEAHRM